MARCERCKRAIPKGKRWCKSCAVEVAKEFGLDSDIPQEPADDEDPVVAYEQKHHKQTLIAIGIICLMLAVCVWVIWGGA